MKFSNLATLVMAFALLFLSSTTNAEEKKQFVIVKVPYASIFKQLDPKSDIVEQAKQGDYLEVLSKGESWYLVKTKNAQGWIEKRSGEIVDRQGGHGFAIIIAILLLIGTTGIVFYFISKQKTSGA
jgi:hypothetical protein